MLPPPTMMASSRSRSSSSVGELARRIARPPAASMVSSDADEASASPDILSTTRRLRCTAPSPLPGCIGRARRPRRPQPPTTTWAKRTTSAEPRSPAMVCFSSLAYDCSSRHTLFEPPVHAALDDLRERLLGLALVAGDRLDRRPLGGDLGLGGTSSRRRYSGRAKATCTAMSCARSTLPPRSSTRTALTPRPAWMWR